jgi:hypothetical protein
MNSCMLSQHKTKEAVSACESTVTEEATGDSDTWIWKTA